MRALPDTWYGAIRTRVSRRVYDGRPLTAAASKEMQAFCTEFRPFSDVRVVLIEDEHLDAFSKVRGGYGHITNPAAMLVFVGSNKALDASLHAGYVGEAAILEATSLGLDTCWTHRFFSPSKLSHYLTLELGERIFAATPIGKAVETPTVGERLAASLFKSRHRKPIETLATPDCLAFSGGMYVPMIEAVRLAPSPMNRQIWRFGLEKKRVILSTADAPEIAGLSKRVDCGIAMLHFEIAAQACGLRGRWIPASPPAVAEWEADFVLVGNPVPSRSAVKPDLPTLALPNSIDLRCPLASTTTAKVASVAPVFK